MPTTVANVRKTRYYEYIGRGSKWGNPYTHLNVSQTNAQFQVATREEAIIAYAEYILKSPLLKDIHELQGKTLGCYCHPKSCHGHILAVLADNPDVRDLPTVLKLAGIGSPHDNANQPGQVDSRLSGDGAQEESTKVGCTPN